jgi:hypothetical protein
VMGSPKSLLAMVMVAAPAAGALVASAVPVSAALVVGLAVTVAVPVSRSSRVVLDSPHAAATAATRHRAAQSKQNFFIVSPYTIAPSRETRLSTFLSGKRLIHTRLWGVVS